MSFTDDQLHICIPGKPLAQKRPKFARHGKFVRAYNPQETEAGRFMHRLQAAIERQRRGWTPITVPVEMDVVFIMPIPASTSKRQARLMEEGEIRHAKKPDLDNLIKFVKDCGTAILWQDDSQLDRIRAAKEYGREPQTIINLRWPAEEVEVEDAIV